MSIESDNRTFLGKKPSGKNYLFREKVSQNQKHHLIKNNGDGKCQ